jgi:hypothetical protein
MPLVLNGATSGSTTINPTDAVTVVLTAPATSGTLAVSDGSTSFTNLAYTGTLTGGTGVVNLGSGQFYKDASGNIGVGTASPYAPANYGSLTVNGTNGGTVSLFTNGTRAFTAYTTSANAVLGSVTSIPLVFNTADTERMRIDSSGNLLVGTTSALISSARRGISVLAPAGTFVAAAFANEGGSSAQTVDIWNKATTSNNYFTVFLTEASPVERGTISYNRAGGLTAYNTTSDYRAKDIISPVLNSGEVIDSVPVYMGKMKDATQARPMFIAHETPDYAHTGEKDAVNKDGKPIYQQMDASSLVPVLWAEVQSLRKRLTALEAQLGAK